MGVYRIPAIISGVAISGKAANIWHMRPASDALADVQAAVDEIQTFYSSLASRYNTSTVIAIGGRVLRIDVDPQPIIPVTQRTVTGTDAGGTTPPQLANVVSWRTTLAGKSYRGRTYLGPFASSQLSGNQWTSGLATQISTSALALIAGGHLVVWSEKLQTATTVTLSMVDAHCETMRSRN